jgi:hypothetical protein
LGSQSPSGPSSSDAERPASVSDWGAGLAIAGFLCGLGSIIALILAFIFGVGAVPGFSSSEGALLLVATFPVALVGIILSYLGRQSTSRRGLASAGMILSVTTMDLSFLGVVLLLLTARL